MRLMTKTKNEFACGSNLSNAANKIGASNSSKSGSMRSDLVLFYLGKPCVPLFRCSLPCLIPVMIVLSPHHHQSLLIVPSS